MIFSTFISTFTRLTCAHTTPSAGVLKHRILQYAHLVHELDHKYVTHILSKSHGAKQNHLNVVSGRAQAQHMGVLQSY
ncbi:hypothetical protein BDR04DRAFT_287646 [Suillus decipiens]|nr:hypothetical protein BDR04DRAFT_287646 [Suillus decipiens]